jgi:hypothetical protein
MPFATMSLLATQMTDVVSTSPHSKHTLPGQLHLLRKLTLLPPTLTATNCDSIAQLGFVFDAFPCAGTVVREVDAGEGARAEVV